MTQITFALKRNLFPIETTNIFLNSMNANFSFGIVINGNELNICFLFFLFTYRYMAKSVSFMDLGLARRLQNCHFWLVTMYWICCLQTSRECEWNFVLRVRSTPSIWLYLTCIVLWIGIIVLIVYSWDAMSFSSIAQTSIIQNNTRKMEWFMEFDIQMKSKYAWQPMYNAMGTYSVWYKLNRETQWNTR